LTVFTWFTSTAWLSALPFTTQHHKAFMHRIAAWLQATRSVSSDHQVVRSTTKIYHRVQ